MYCTVCNTHRIPLIFYNGEGNGNPLQYSCLENPLNRGAYRLESMGSLRVGQYWASSLSLFTFIHWRRKWQPTPVFLPGESQGWGSLVGCRLWSRTESDMTGNLAAAAAIFYNNYKWSITLNILNHYVIYLRHIILDINYTGYKTINKVLKNCTPWKHLKKLNKFHTRLTCPWHHC